MRPEVERRRRRAATAIAPASGASRPLLDRLVTVAENNVVDLVEREAGDLDRRVGEDQLLELDLQLVQVPFALFAEAIDGEAQNALLGLAKMLDPHAGTRPRPRAGLDPNSAIDDGMVSADKDRRTEAKGADRARHLAHMGRVELADLA